MRQLGFRIFAAATAAGLAVGVWTPVVVQAEPSRGATESHAAVAKPKLHWSKHPATLKTTGHMLLTLNRPTSETCSLRIHRPNHAGKKWTYSKGRGRIQFDIDPVSKARPGKWVIAARCVPTGSTSVKTATTSFRLKGKRSHKSFLVGKHGPAFAVPRGSGSQGAPKHLPRVGGKGGSTGDDYPYKGRVQDSGFDPWGEYYRECTSFAAWALHSRNHFEMPFHGDAGDWGGLARARGYAVNSTPAIGAIAWQPRSKAHFWGHVAWVSSVSGHNVTIQEYNYDGHGHYNSRTVASSAFQYIHFKDVTFTPPATPSPPSTPPPPSAPPSRAETTGGVAHTWTNYLNAGGTQGPSIASNKTVQISCRRTGFQVADGNTWWYRIASSPWNNAYWVSADAFYNNGATSGSLHGTPFVDTAVPTC